MRDLEGDFLDWWNMIAGGQPEPVSQYRFAAHHVGLGPGIRKRLKAAKLQDWKFDFAWIDNKVAVEMEGGTWSGGAHVRGTGYDKDCKKYNAAQMLGWLVLRFTGTIMDPDPMGCIEMVQTALIKTQE